MSEHFLTTDSETGGMTAKKQTLLTCYFAVMDENKAILDDLQLKLKPKAGKGYVCDARALEVTGINLTEHDREAIPLEQGQELLREFLIKNTKNGRLKPLGQNVDFDLNFYWENLMPQAEWYQYCTEDVEDTLKIARELKKAKKLALPSLKLGVMCDHFTIPLANSHSEKDDAIATALLHSRLVALRDGKIGETKGEPQAPLRPPKSSEPCPCPSVPFLPLKAISQFTILRGASSIDQYLKWAKEHGCSAIGLTDESWASGLLEFYTKARQEKITPVPGLVIQIADASDQYDLTLWATNQAGYRNIVWLSSQGFSKVTIRGKLRAGTSKHGPVPRVTFEELLGHLAGVTVGTGGYNGLIGRFGISAEERIRQLSARTSVVLEITPRPHSHMFDMSAGGFVPFTTGDKQKKANEDAMDLSIGLDLPLILSQDAHYANSNDRDVQDLLLQNLDPTGGSRHHQPHHLMTTEEAWDAWNSMHPGKSDEFVRGILTGHALAERAEDLKIEDEYHLPTIELPQDIEELDLPETDKHKVFIYRQIEKHGRMRWDDQQWIDRLNMEMGVICDNGRLDFARYFLFLEKWATWTRDNSILSGAGRGSGAGSLLCYLLKITHLNPFKFDLPFERFLSQGRIERGKYPDIDWDLGFREPLIAMLQHTYGERFAQASTHGKLRVKKAIKYACGIQLGWNQSDDRVEAITKKIDDTPTGVDDRDFLIGYIDREGIEHEGELTKKPELQAFFNEYPEVYERVMDLLGKPSSAGRHASAYFISDRPIVESAPLCEISGMVCTQYTAPPIGFNAAEKAGLVKFDLLTVNTLNDVASAIRMIQQRLGYKVWKEDLVIGEQKFEVWKGELAADVLPMTDGTLLDIYELMEDPAVFQMISDGKTESLFQVSSSLMTTQTKRIKPRRLMEMSDVVAIVRPGPLKAVIEDGKTTMADAYIKRKHGEMPVTYAHPDMEPILRRTYGVAVYQEDLQRMFSDLAGYSAQEADEIRELIGKKKRQEMEKAIPELRRRLAARGWTDGQTTVFVDLCIASSSYSFNRSHSAAYGLLAYQSAFLKHHFPLEWWTAVLQNAKVEDIREKGYARALKDVLALPHVNGPTDTFELRDGKVHAPIYLVDRIGDSACAAIKQARETGGDFKSFQDFFERAKVNKTVITHMILVGGFDQIEPGRTAQDLLQEYALLSRASELKKYGAGKTGPELMLAAAQYAIAVESGEEKAVEVPYSEMGGIEVEKLRLDLLPIYRLNVVDRFRSILQKQLLIGHDGGATYSGPLVGRSIPVVTRVSQAEEHYQEFGASREAPPVAWVGIVKSRDPFEYQDKKTKKKVQALRTIVANDGDEIECILWPDLYEKFRRIETIRQEGKTVSEVLREDFEGNKGLKWLTDSTGKELKCSLALFAGVVKPSRDPGKWSMSVTEVRDLETYRE
jgi:DNA polymerase-3 subunit alpha